MMKVAIALLLAAGVNAFGQLQPTRTSYSTSSPAGYTAVPGGSSVGQWCGVGSDKALDHHNKKSLAQCAQMCTDEPKCTHFVHFNDDYCLTHDKCTVGPNPWKEYVGTIYQKGAGGATLSTDAALNKLVELMGKQLWLDHGSGWTEDMRSKATVVGNGVKYNGYFCQAFGSGADGPVDPNAGGRPSHKGLPFTLPAGMFIPNPSMPGLDKIHAELVGAFGWGSMHLEVGRANGDGFDTITTGTATSGYTGKSWGQASTTPTPFAAKDGKPAGKFCMICVDGDEWTLGGGSYDDGSAYESGSLSRLLACRRDA